MNHILWAQNFLIRASKVPQIKIGSFKKLFNSNIYLGKGGGKMYFKKLRQISCNARFSQMTGTVCG